MNLKEMLERRKIITETEIEEAKTNDELDVLETELRKLDMMIAEKRKIEEKKEVKTNDRTAAVNSTTPGMVNAANIETKKSDDEKEMEYRKAFQNFVSKGTPIPAELRTDENTLTTDIATAIPTVLVNRIVEKLESIGNILPLVTKTSFASGVSIPTSSVKPVATWVSEGAGSDRQQKTTSNISFGSFKLRCEISMSLESSVMAISAFENAFVKNVTDAMVKKIEATIVSDADGTASPKGILAETVATGQNVDIVADNGALEYSTLVDTEALLPLAYESGAVWFMTKKTFMGFIGMMVDGQPVARVNYGLAGVPERVLLGRKVILNDYMTSFALDVDNDAVVAFLFNPADYAINTVYNMGVQRKQDWETDDMLTKAVMILDGKVVDKNSLVTVTKKA